MKELLDVKADNIVNLSHLQDLIGFEKVYEKPVTSHIKKSKDKALTQDALKQKKNAFRAVMTPLILKRVSQQRLRMDFKANVGLQNIPGVISKKTFIEILEHECSSGTKIPSEHFEEVARQFKYRIGDVVEYEEFLVAYQAAISMNEASSYFFSTLDLICTRDKRKNITEVIEAAVGEKNLKTLSKNQFKKLLSVTKIDLSPQEIDMFFMDFDLTGKYLTMEISELEAEFKIFKGGDAQKVSS